jgi:hypothetical protein
MSCKTKIKKSLLKGGFKKTYFCSTWILNLGVVPLLRLTTFLFWPIFVFLRWRRFSVTRVLETITLLLTTAFQQLLTLFRRANIALKLSNVKEFALLCAISFTGPQLLHAQENLLLALGEHREINVLDLQHFINGNREVLNVHHDKERNALILRGAMQGYSELFIKRHSGQEERLAVFVLSKKDHLELYQMAEVFESMRLRVVPKGLSLQVQGTIQTRAHYRRLHQALKQLPNALDLRVEISENVQKVLIADVYRRFFDHFADSIDCHFENISLYCQYEQGHEIPENELLELQGKDFVHFRTKLGVSGQSNYRLKLKLVQLEQTDGREISLGLDGLNLSWADIFYRTVRSIVEEKSVLLRDQNIVISTLAEPETLVQLGSSAMLKIGSEIPFSEIQPTTGATQTQWKFAGLQVDLDLQRKGNHYQVHYKTGFTRPDGEAISGNRESSTILINPGSPLAIFNIHFQSIGENESGFPVLKNIPILKHLFASSSKQSTYKTLTGVLSLERENL